MQDVEFINRLGYQFIRQDISNLKKLLKALSGTVSWNLRTPKASDAASEPAGKKEKQKNARASALKKGFSGS